MKSIVLMCDNSTGPDRLSASTTHMSDPSSWETDFAALVPRFTGGLSAISSALIIYVIIRSNTRLSSIYHRIMFGMSLADTFGSIAMALTSLPMPSYMPKEEVFGYHWAGAKGNMYTCDAQGFFAFFGMIGMFNYNAMLCVYYACAIAFTMRERNIKKYVEPFLHAIPLIVGLGLSVPPLFYEMYNPGVSAYAWCGVVTYPNKCGPEEEGVECIRGTAKTKSLLQILLSMSMILVFMLIFIPLAMVIWKVIQTDCIMYQLSKLYRERGYEEMEKVLNKHRNTKAVLLQASAYIVAFLLGSIPPLLLAMGAVSHDKKYQVPNNGSLERLILVFLPLQGFFNFIIFISHKIYNYRRVHDNVGICHVIKLLFCTSSHDPFFISRMYIVKNDESGGSQVVEDLDLAVTNPVYDIDIRDESNQELHYRLGLMNINIDIDPSTMEDGTRSMDDEEHSCTLSSSGPNAQDTSIIISEGVENAYSNNCNNIGSSHNSINSSGISRLCSSDMDDEGSRNSMCSCSSSSSHSIVGTMNLSHVQDNLEKKVQLISEKTYYR